MKFNNEEFQSDGIGDKRPTVPYGIRKYAGVLSVLAGGLAILAAVLCVQDIVCAYQDLGTYGGDPTRVGHAIESYAQAQISDAIITFAGAVFLGLFSLSCVKVALGNPKWLVATCCTSAACGLFYLYLAAAERKGATLIVVAIAWFSAFVLRPRAST